MLQRTVDNEKGPATARPFPVRLSRNYCLFAGAPVVVGFTGAPPAGAASVPSTVPLMRMTFVGSFPAFEVIVTLLLIGPTRFVSYTTEISDFAPGAIGAVSHFGTVHPHEPLHVAMSRAPCRCSSP